MRLETAAFQGERGAFSEEAARRLLGSRVKVLPCQRFEELFRNLTEKRVQAAVVPIENTLAGSVHENYDHLLHHDLPIVAETNVRIVHNLIAPPGVPFRKIRRVFSHPVALNQCLNFFSDHPRKQLTDAAGIASALAATNYGAVILKRSLEDDRKNFTRFFLLRRPEFARKFPVKTNSRTKWKTSLVFTTRNIPGALFRSLSAFALRDLNLAKIESRPLRGKPWEYLFYLDFFGRVDDPVSQKALGHLQEITDFFRVLGCYPQGD
jgi:prephenate dehydratase